MLLEKKKTLHDAVTKNGLYFNRLTKDVNDNRWRKLAANKHHVLLLLPNVPDLNFAKRRIIIRLNYRSSSFKGKICMLVSSTCYVLPFLGNTLLML